MNLMCLLGRHWWQYHGYPKPERRICTLCFQHQKLKNNEWVRG